MKKRVFIYLIVVQAFIIGIFIYSIYKKSLIQNISVSPIKKENLNMHRSGNLNHFYEPTLGFDKAAPQLPGGKKANYSINDDTLNSSRNYLPEKPKETFRIITLGDSFTYGLYVDTDKNWPSRLEKLLNQNLSCYNNFEVINLGVYGYDNQYSVERYKLRGKKYDPDIVIWLQVDLTRVTEDIIPLQIKYRDKANESGELEQLSAGGEIYEIWNRAKIDVIKQYGESNILDFQKKKILELSELYKNKLVIAYIQNALKPQEEALLKNISLTAKNIQLIALSSIYSNGGAFENDLHPNEKGHEMITKSLYKFLLEKNLVDCKN